MSYALDLECAINQQDTLWRGEMFIAPWEISTRFWKSFPLISFPLYTMEWGLCKQHIAVFDGFRKGHVDCGIANLNIPQADFF